MAEFRFQMPCEWELNSYLCSSIHIVGLDGIPWPCKVTWDAESKKNSPPEKKSQYRILKVTRNRDESGKLFFVYPFQAFGEILIHTGTLPPRDEPYSLLIELARGTLNHLRSQVSIWNEGGLKISCEIHDKITLATQVLCRAIMTTARDEQNRLARESIETGMSAMFDLATSFGNQIAPYRKKYYNTHPFWLASPFVHCEKPDNPDKQVEFDRCVVPSRNGNPTTAIPEISHGNTDSTQPIILGPLLDASICGFSSQLQSLPDFASRKTEILDDCRQQLSQLPVTTSLIHVASGLNGIGHRHLSYPQQNQLTIEILQLLELQNVNLPIMISFDYPWAERLANAVGGMHPLQVADTLLRQGLPVSVLGLDINLDFWPNGSVLRDPMQWIDLLDSWAQLDLPLVLRLRIPSGNPPVSPESPVDRQSNHQRSNVTDEQRLHFLETVLPMIVARPAVQGIIWPQWNDQDDPRFPYGGLVDERGAAKPILNLIAKLKSEYSAM